MADESAKESAGTLEYESRGPVQRGRDYLGCAAVLVVFLSIAWIAFEFIQMLFAK